MKILKDGVDIKSSMFDGICHAQHSRKGLLVSVCRDAYVGMPTDSDKRH